MGPDTASGYQEMVRISSDLQEVRDLRVDNFARLPFEVTTLARATAVSAVSAPGSYRAYIVFIIQCKVKQFSQKDCTTVTASGRITEGGKGAWPPERPGGPLETTGLRGYKGRGPPEIARQIQYIIATYQYHSSPHRVPASYTLLFNSVSHMYQQFTM